MSHPNSPSFPSSPPSIQYCNCCPHGYHIDVGFVDFAAEVNSGQHALHKLNRYKGRLHKYRERGDSVNSACSQTSNEALAQNSPSPNAKRRQSENLSHQLVRNQSPSPPTEIIPRTATISTNVTSLSTTASLSSATSITTTNITSIQQQLNIFQEVNSCFTSAFYNPKENQLTTENITTFTLSPQLCSKFASQLQTTTSINERLQFLFLLINILNIYLESFISSSTNTSSSTSSSSSPPSSSSSLILRFLSQLFLRFHSLQHFIHISCTQESHNNNINSSITNKTSLFPSPNLRLKSSKALQVNPTMKTISTEMMMLDQQNESTTTAKSTNNRTEIKLVPFPSSTVLYSSPPAAAATASKPLMMDAKTGPDYSRNEIENQLNLTWKAKYQQSNDVEIQTEKQIKIRNFQDQSCTFGAGFANQNNLSTSTNLIEFQDFSNQTSQPEFTNVASETEKLTVQDSCCSVDLQPEKIDSFTFIETTEETKPLVQSASTNTIIQSHQDAINQYGNQFNVIHSSTEMDRKHDDYDSYCHSLSHSQATTTQDNSTMTEEKLLISTATSTEAIVYQDAQAETDLILSQDSIVQHNLANFMDSSTEMDRQIWNHAYSFSMEQITGGGRGGRGGSQDTSSQISPDYRDCFTEPIESHRYHYPRHHASVSTNDFNTMFYNDAFTQMDKRDYFYHSSSSSQPITMSQNSSTSSSSSSSAIINYQDSSTETLEFQSIHTSVSTDTLDCHDFSSCTETVLYQDAVTQSKIKQFTDSFTQMNDFDDDDEDCKRIIHSGSCSTKRTIKNASNEAMIFSQEMATQVENQQQEFVHVAVSTDPQESLIDYQLDKSINFDQKLPETKDTFCETDSESYFICSHCHQYARESEEKSLTTNDFATQTENSNQFIIQSGSFSINKTYQDDSSENESIETTSQQQQQEETISFSNQPNSISPIYEEISVHCEKVYQDASTDMIPTLNQDFAAQTEWPATTEQAFQDSSTETDCFLFPETTTTAVASKKEKDVEETEEAASSSETIAIIQFNESHSFTTDDCDDSMTFSQKDVACETESEIHQDLLVHHEMKNMSTSTTKISHEIIYQDSSTQTESITTNDYSNSIINQIVLQPPEFMTTNKHHHPHPHQHHHEYENDEQSLAESHQTFYHDCLSHLSSSKLSQKSSSQIIDTPSSWSGDEGSFTAKDDECNSTSSVEDIPHDNDHVHDDDEEEDDDDDDDYDIPTIKDDQQDDDLSIDGGTTTTTTTKTDATTDGNKIQEADLLSNSENLSIEDLFQEEDKIKQQEQQENVLNEKDEQEIIYEEVITETDTSIHYHLPASSSSSMSLSIPFKTFNDMDIQTDVTFNVQDMFNSYYEINTEIDTTTETIIQKVVDPHFNLTTTSNVAICETTMLKPSLYKTFSDASTETEEFMNYNNYVQNNENVIDSSSSSSNRRQQLIAVGCSYYEEEPSYQDTYSEELIETDDTIEEERKTQKDKANNDDDDDDPVASTCREVANALNAATNLWNNPMDLTTTTTTATSTSSSMELSSKETKNSLYSKHVSQLEDGNTSRTSTSVTTKFIQYPTVTITDDQCLTTPNYTRTISETIHVVDDQEEFHSTIVKTLPNEPNDKIGILQDKSKASSSSSFALLVLPDLNCEVQKRVEAAAIVLTLWLDEPQHISASDLNEALLCLREEWFLLTTSSENLLMIPAFIKLLTSYHHQLTEKVVNFTDNKENTALHYAVGRGSWQVVHSLLSVPNIDVNKVNKTGYTPLMLAAFAKIQNDADFMVANELLSQCDDVNRRAENERGETTLLLASQKGNTALVQALLNYGADVNAADGDGNTPLMWAAECGAQDIVYAIVNTPEADCSLVDSCGKTAVDIAMDSGHKEIALFIYSKQQHLIRSNSKRKSKRRHHSASSTTSTSMTRSLLFQHPQSPK